MQTVTDPNSAGSAVLATSGAGELERLRFVLRHVTAWTQWWTNYEDVNLRNRTLRVHQTVQTATNTKSMLYAETTGSGTGTRFHAVAFGFVNQGVHHETALLRYHVNTTTIALLLSLGGDLHLGGTLMLGAPGAASHAAIFLGAHTNTGFFWPANDALAITIKGGTAGGGELVRFHTGGLMAAVNGSYDVGTGAGSRFRHLHLTGDMTAGGHSVWSGSELPPAGTVRYFGPAGSASGLTWNVATDGAHDWTENNVQRMRLISGILAIGTTTTTGATVGDIVLTNNAGELKFVNNLGTSTLSALNSNASDQLVSVMIRDNTTASAANVFVDATTGALLRSTSVRGAKLNLVPLSLAEAQKLWRVQANTFTDRTLGVPLAGFVADEVEAAGLDRLLERDGAGIGVGVRYGMVSAYLLELLRDHEHRLADIEQRRN